MSYEVRFEGRTLGVWDSQEEALEQVRQALAENPDSEPEVIDLATGQPLAPGATGPERDDLANKIGY